ELSGHPNRYLSQVFRLALNCPFYRHFGVLSFLPLLVIPSIVCLLFLFLFLPETRGREVHDVVDELIEQHKSGGKNNKLRNISSSVLTPASILPIESLKNDTKCNEE
ncbi:hypothetical protein PMAYCL1PPCAC_17224, partial [Pristionchus mayeri]